jgi:YlmC/YmxH family sporulation protein
VNCRIIDMRHKEVINIKDGTRLGCVCDVEIDTVNAKVIAIVVYGRLRCFGLFGREDDIIIKWQDIQVIGDDTILVTYNCYCRTKKRSRGFGGLFGGG